MTLGIALAALSLLQPTDQALQSIDVAFEEMAAQDNEAAIERIEANVSLEQNDPARLINLGVALAREGRVTEAKAMFEAAAHSETRYRLETADGEWVDSRRLAYRALAMLENGEFSAPTRMASR